jgi:hypothetical protein
MTKTVFNNLKKLKYAGIPLPKFASWAIWDKKKEKNEDIPQIVEKNIGNATVSAIKFPLLTVILMVTHGDWHGRGGYL